MLGDTGQWICSTFPPVNTGFEIEKPAHLCLGSLFLRDIMFLKVLLFDYQGCYNMKNAAIC